MTTNLNPLSYTACLKQAERLLRHNWAQRLLDAHALAALGVNVQVEDTSLTFSAPGRIGFYGEPDTLTVRVRDDGTWEAFWEGYDPSQTHQGSHIYSAGDFEGTTLKEAVAEVLRLHYEDVAARAATLSDSLLPE